MKNVIKKAIAGGLKVSDIFPIFKDDTEKYQRAVVKVEDGKYINGITFLSCEIRHRADSSGWTSYENIDPYHLIFGTNLIECLVGECFDELCGNLTCSFYMTFNEGNCGGIIGGESALANCKKAIRYKQDASYHREKMSSLKDVEALKDYLRNLVNSQEGKG